MAQLRSLLAYIRQQRRLELARELARAADDPKRAREIRAKLYPETERNPK